MTDYYQEHLVACTAARRQALAALAATVANLRIDETSERQAADLLANELAERGITSYWYPAGESAGSRQSGCIVAFDTQETPSRTAFTNGRHQVASDRIRWQGFGYFYASPQAMTSSGLVAWGDIGCTVYLGGDPAVRSAVRSAWQRNRAVIERLAEVSDPTTVDLFELNAQESAKRALTNIAWSESEKGYNIGHCFPTTRTTSLDSAEADDLLNRRRYVDGITDLPLNGALWTFEARDRARSYPLGAVQFHDILSVDIDKLVTLPSYDQLLREIGMEWVVSDVPITIQ